MHSQSPPPPPHHHRHSPSSPHKLPRLCGGEVTMASSAPPQPLLLGLGLGGGETTTATTAKSAFTFLQMQELQQQVLIYKYMVCGLPVPLHLVVPIWKSVAAAGSSSFPCHYPAFMECGGLCFDYRNMMEPEPGRCRRTDGKKWRCSRDVVPDQKYCERHMHRGRHRSRKPVELGTAVAAATGLSLMPPTTTTITTPNSSVPSPTSVL